MRHLKRISALLLALVFAAGLFVWIPVSAEGSTVLTILYTNDVHGAIEGYSTLAGYKEQLKSDGKEVIAVDAGDAVQGELIDSITKGEASVDLMNAVQYDLAVPGNHEFDYEMEQFLKLKDKAAYTYLSCNFYDLKTNAPVLTPYVVAEYGGHKIGFIGITTPETYTKSTPKYFQDESGNYIYSFKENEFYSTIQGAIDKAKGDGAEYIVAIGHTGIAGTDTDYNTESIIKNTSGIDTYIDGHSHEEVPGPGYNGETFKDKDGEDVYVTQTGTKFANIGKLEITFDTDSSTFSESAELIKTTDAAALITDEAAKDQQAAVQKIIDADHEKLIPYTKTIASSEVDITILDPETEKRVVRTRECNAGNFVADAYKAIMGCDIAIANGGGIRADIKKGDVTEMDIRALNPWGNKMCIVKATGQQILDALEYSTRKYPDENGGFIQCAGMTYKIDPTVASPAQSNEKGEFTGIKEGAERRVYDVKVNGVAIDPKATYTVGGSQYVLLNAGDGMTMWKGAELVKDYGKTLVDSDMLVTYVTSDKYLNGVIPASLYSNPAGSGRIAIAEKPEEEKPAKTPPTGDESYALFYVALLAASLAAAAGVNKARKQDL